MTINSWIRAILLTPLPALAGVQAFTTSDQPFTNLVSGITPCLVDQGGAALQEMTNPEKQKAIAGMNPSDLNPLISAMNCTYQAASLGIEKVPAVVVDQKYVVYGNTDMTAAVAEISNAQA